MNQVLSNNCKIEKHYNKEKDQICLNEECDLMQMCLYCRMQDHNKNHDVVPIEELSIKIKQLRDPKVIKEGYYKKIAQIFDQIQKNVYINIDFLQDETNYFKHFQQIQENNFKVGEDDFHLQDSSKMKLLVKILKFYEEDILNKDLLNEENKQQTVQIMTNQFLSCINQIEKAQDDKDNTVDQLINQLYEKQAEQNQEIELQKEENKYLKDEISLKSKKIEDLQNQLSEKEKENLLRNKVDKQSQKLEEEEEEEEDKIEDIDLKLIKAQSEKLVDNDEKFQQIMKKKKLGLNLDQAEAYKNQKGYVDQLQMQLKQYAITIQKLEEENKNLAYINEIDFESFLESRIQKYNEDEDMKQSEKKQLIQTMIKSAMSSIKNIAKNYRIQLDDDD